MAFTLTFTPCQEGLYDLPSPTRVADCSATCSVTCIGWTSCSFACSKLKLLTLRLVLVMDAAISSYNKKQQSNLELMQRMIDNNNVVDR